MTSSVLPKTHDVVLIGGGHSHALVLRMWGMRPLAGARLTVINPSPTAPYSGMLPGFVAGHYPRSALDIDLVQLARFAGARVILGAATHLDSQAGQVHVPGRPPIGFDLASVDVGITSAMPDLPGFAEFGVPAKPLGQFAAAWEAYLATDGPAQVCVIGAGVAGAELAAAMAHALTALGRDASVTLIEAGRAFAALRPAAGRRLHRALTRLGVTVIEQAPVTALTEGAVHLQDGRSLPSDFTVGAAGTRAHGWLAASGLTDAAGFLPVAPSLQTADPRIFAVGDCAEMPFAPRPKAGVYAVRQAPILFHNLRAALTQTRMRSYFPQKDYLKLISLGGKRALADRFGIAPEGVALWSWKDRIDQRFMQKFRDLPAMPAPALPRERTHALAETLGPKPMCGGCGAKVGRDALGAVLAERPAPRRADVTPLPGDDAALLQTGGVRQVLTTDHLRSFTEDPVIMARIAAHHALGDIWAMGACPQAATANLILPRQSAPLMQRQLAEIMHAAQEVLHAAGAEVVGGHSSLGAELTIGFSITGLLDRDPITLAGAEPGDALLLTRALGSGTVLAGEMVGQARGADVAATLAELQRSQQQAADILRDSAHAMTDVTGFGLAGHLLGMCTASGLAADLSLDAIPLLPGAADLARRGIRSTLYPENRAAVPSLPDRPDTALLFDPQTAGGMLAAVPPEMAQMLCNRLRDAGYTAARVGALALGPPRVTLSE